MWYYIANITFVAFIPGLSTKRYELEQKPNSRKVTKIKYKRSHIQDRIANSDGYTANINTQYKERSTERDEKMNINTQKTQSSNPRDDKNKVIVNIPTEEILPNRAQPRKAFDNASLWQLAKSIKKHGVLQPITIKRREVHSEYDTFKYELIAGERRLRASRLIGNTEIPAIILEINDKESAELAIIENLHRENLNIFEEAAAIAALIDLHDLTQEEIATQLSLTQSAIANKLRLLKLTEAERTLIITNDLSERHARALLRLKDSTERAEALAYIINNNLNVKQSELHIDRILSPQRSDSEHSLDYKAYISAIQKAICGLRTIGTDAKTSCSETDSELIYTISISKSRRTSDTEITSHDAS